jgi:hypothetical protein
MNKILRAVYETRLEEASDPDKKLTVLREAIDHAYVEGHKARSREVQNAFLQLGFASDTFEED